MLPIGESVSNVERGFRQWKAPLPVVGMAMEGWLMSGQRRECYVTSYVNFFFPPHTLVN